MELTSPERRCVHCCFRRKTKSNLPFGFENLTNQRIVFCKNGARSQSRPSSVVVVVVAVGGGGGGGGFFAVLAVVVVPRPASL